MAAYVHGSGSYASYLQQQGFHQEIRWDLSAQNMNLVSNRQAIEAAGGRIERAVTKGFDDTRSTINQGLGQIRSGMDQGFSEVSGKLDDIDESLTRGFVSVHFDLLEIESSIRDFSARFDWGIGRLETSLGTIQDSLQQLISLSQTPEQTWAIEQFDVARAAFKRKLYPESLEHIERAINGYQGHTGYKLEHRFHHLLGVLRKGDYENHSIEVLDLQKAEEAYLATARYAGDDYAIEAARAYCAAAYVAYCRGNTEDAITHSHRSLSIVNLPEANFGMAKYLMHKDALTDGIAYLERAVLSDPLYALKCFNDGDFLKHEDAVRNTIQEWTARLVEKCNALHTAAENTSSAVSHFMESTIDTLRPIKLIRMPQPLAAEQLAAQVKPAIDAVALPPALTPYETARSTYEKRTELLTSSKHMALHLEYWTTNLLATLNNTIQHTKDDWDVAANSWAKVVAFVPPLLVLPLAMQWSDSPLISVYVLVSLGWAVFMHGFIEHWLHERKVSQVSSQLAPAITRITDGCQEPKNRIVELQEYVQSFGGPHDRLER